MMVAGLGIVVLLLAALVVWTRVLWRRAEAQVPPAGEFCDVYGGVIHYRDLGPKEAPALVLIHGLAGQLQHFTYAMADDLAQDFRVIVIDRPGCGYSRRDHDGLADLREQARMIWACLDRLDVSSPVIVGHSLGGAVALTMAITRPGAARALALICPATHPMQDAPEAFRGLQLRTPQMRRLLGHVLAVPLAWLTTKPMFRQVFAPEPWPQDFLTRGGAALGYRPDAFVAASADLTMMEYALPWLQTQYDAALTTPGAILFGGDDAILSPDQHGASMAAYGLTCETLPGRGHMLPITAPDDCCAFVRRVAKAV